MLCMAGRGRVYCAEQEPRKKGEKKKHRGKIAGVSREVIPKQVHRCTAAREYNKATEAR